MSLVILAEHNNYETGYRCWVFGVYKCSPMYDKLIERPSANPFTEVLQAVELTFISVAYARWSNWKCGRTQLLGYISQLAWPVTAFMFSCSDRYPMHDPGEMKGEPRVCVCSDIPGNLLFTRSRLPRVCGYLHVCTDYIPDPVTSPWGSGESGPPAYVQTPWGGDPRPPTYVQTTLEIYENCWNVFYICGWGYQGSN